jgi:hypothetical protein
VQIVAILIIATAGSQSGRPTPEHAAARATDRVWPCFAGMRSTEFVTILAERVIRRDPADQEDRGWPPL